MPWSHAWHPLGALGSPAQECRVLVASEQRCRCSPEPHIYIEVHICTPLQQPLGRLQGHSPAGSRQWLRMKTPFEESGC